MQDSLPSLDGHVVKNISYVYLKEHTRKKKKKALQKYILFLLGEPSVGLIITDKISTVSQGNTTH